jgi:hypothetical protein
MQQTESGRVMSNHDNHYGYSTRNGDLTAENTAEQPLSPKGASKWAKN